MQVPACFSSRLRFSFLSFPIQALLCSCVVRLCIFVLFKSHNDEFVPSASYRPNIHNRRFWLLGISNISSWNKVWRKLPISAYDGNFQSCLWGNTCRGTGTEDKKCPMFFMKHANNLINLFQLKGTFRVLYFNLKKVHVGVLEQCPIIPTWQVWMTLFLIIKWVLTLFTRRDCLTHKIGNFGFILLRYKAGQYFESGITI